MSLCCDVRIMTQQGHIGLNEVALGISVPPFWARLMANVIGNGPAERLCLTAAVISPQEALKLGMIDQVHSSPLLANAFNLSFYERLPMPFKQHRARSVLRRLRDDSYANRLRHN